MSDPLSVLSGAAGIISLGVTACQGLITYYQAWEAWEDDVRGAMKDVEHVSKFLSLLKARIDKLPADQIDIVNQAHAAKARLAEAIKKFEDIRDNCKAVPAQNGERHKWRNFSRRSLYPFKQSTLRELRDAVRGAREVLTSLLQLLQIDVKQDTEHLRNDVKKIASETDKVGRSITTLEPKIDEIFKASESSTRIESDVKLLVGETKGVCNQVEVLEQDLNRLNVGLASASAMQAIEFAAFHERLSHMETAQTTLVALATTRGSLFLGNPHIATAAFSPAENVMLEQAGSDFLGTRSLSPCSTQLGYRLCSCRKRTRRYQTSYTVGWLRLLSSSENIVDHSKSCPYWNPKVETQFTELAAENIRSVFGKTMKLAMKVTRGAGGFSISPTLTLQGFVRNDSPIFELFTGSAIREHEGSFGEYLDYASTRMLQLFSDGCGSPYDVDWAGRTVLHIIFHNFIEYVSDHNIENFRKLVLTCIAAGVPLNELDNRKRTPLEIIINIFIVLEMRIANLASFNSILIGFYGAGGDFGQSTLERYLPTELQFASRLESWVAVTECGPLSTAIIQKDESKVLQILNRNPAATQELNNKSQSPIHLSAVWPRGIELLLTHGAQKLVNQTDANGWLPISYALKNRNYEASRLLLDAGSALSSSVWWTEWWTEWQNVLNQSLFRYHYDPRFFTLAVEVLQSRRAQLYDFAKQNLPTSLWEKLNLPDDRVLDRDAKRVQKILEDFGIEIPIAGCGMKDNGTVYHSCMFNPTQAEHLFQAGFRDLEAVDDSGFTPLETHCLWRTGFTDGLAFLRWLINKGVDPCRLTTVSKFVSGISGYHMIASLVGAAPGPFTRGPQFPRTDIGGFLTALKEPLDFLDKPSQNLVSDAIRYGGSDACFCACSHGGCSPAIVLLKTLSGDWYPGEPHVTSFIRSSIVNWVEDVSITEQIEIPPQMAADVIRFETAETLGLTHTCCRAGYPWVLDRFTPRCEPHEVTEIHDEEQDLIQEHRQLVEMFVRAYETRGETLSSFLKGYWRVHMAKMLTKCHPMRKDELEGIRRVGVVIRNESNLDRFCAVENHSKSKQDFTHGPSTDLSFEEHVTDEAWYWILRTYRTWSEWGDGDSPSLLAGDRYLAVPRPAMACDQK